MSIVAVHGPQTFGSNTVWNSTKTFQAFAITGDGLTWRFVPADQGQVAGNYDWAWANGTGSAGGSPASPVLNTMIPQFTFPVGPATKTITLTLNGVAQPTLSITIPAVGGTPSPMMLEEGEITQETPVTEGFDPGEHTIVEVQNHIIEHPDEIDAVYESELAGKNRSTLIAWLESAEVTE